MANYRVTRVVVADSKLFNRTGAFGRWAHSVERKFTANAILEAPSGASSGRVNKSRANSAYPVGSMKRSISGDVRRVGIRRFVTTVSVDVPYAIYVLKGTKTPIVATSARIPAGQPGAGQFAPIGFGGRGMYLPGNPGWGRARMRQQVSGQIANPFLDRAFDRTARTHSSLRGHSMIGTF